VQQAQLTQAESEYQRQSTLLSGRATTRQQFKVAQAARDANRAGLDNRRADLARATAAIAVSRAALTGPLRTGQTLFSTRAEHPGCVPQVFL
jgi:multidrug resistance efflux pump